MKTVVVGGGAFGTAIAEAIARSGRPVKLLCRTQIQASSIQTTGRNLTYFPTIVLSGLIEATADCGVCSGADVLFLAFPARELTKSFQQRIMPILRAGTIVVNLIKGFDEEFLTFARRFAIIAPHLEYVSLKGPTFARPVLLNEFGGMTIGATSAHSDTSVRSLFSHSLLDFDSSSSPDAVDAVSALKNIYAILLGIFASSNFGENSTFGLMSKILKEARNVLIALDVSPEILDNYCGTGDILLTGLCETSRNRTFGIMLGKGVIVDSSCNNFLAEGARSVSIVAGRVNPVVGPMVHDLKMLIDGDITVGNMLSKFTGAGSSMALIR